jgi:hypothetical protein
MEVIFPDGDRIVQDDWREDTLIYYLPGSDWGRAIGMKVVCDYSPPVTIRFWEEGLKHLKSLSDSHLALMLQRLAQTFNDHQEYRWKTLTFEFPDWLPARVGEGAILGAFEGTGWQFRSRDAHSFKWTRHSPGEAA